MVDVHRLMRCHPDCMRFTLERINFRRSYQLISVADHSLAKPTHARVLPGPQQLPVSVGGHVGRCRRLSRIHVGKY